MKLKQFIFALVAMLSFSFSSFAQTVTTAADLKAALNSTGAVVTLGDNITMTETISIPTGVSVTLDLNGKNITTSAACDVFEVVGTMVINDSKGTGSVTGKTNRVLYVKAKGKLTINGGRFFKNSGRVVYSAGKLIINGGSVETTPEAALNVNTAAITSATGTLELNGGTVTSIAAQTCDLKIAGATVEAGVNILKTNKSTEITAGTINGNVTIAPEAADNVTVSGGSFEDADAIKNYLASGSAILDKGDGTFEVVAGQFKVGGNYYPTFAAALNAVENGQTIELLEDATGDEKSTEIEFTKDIKFTITGKAPQYALPVVTFQNAEVTIKDAEILIPELDARQNAVINVVNSTVHDAGGNSIAKSYYNGTINIDATSTVYMMQITTMGYINVAGTVNATWQTNVYGNGMISLTEGAKFNTGALHLTGQDYSGRDNTDADRVGKPATIVVDGATLNVGSVKSDNGSDYSYNSSKGINVGTVDGKLALLDVKNGGAVNFYMANGQTTNFGAGATVNVAASTLKTISRDENGTVKLANAGVVNVTGVSNLNIKNYSGNAINATNTTLADVQFGGAVNAFGTNNISGTTTIGGILSLGYGTNPTEQVVVNITGNFNGTNVIVSTNNCVDNILNVGKADGERTTVHFGQLGAFADVNVVNADVTYGYAFIRNDFNATNSTFEIKGGVNTYFSGNAKVVLDNTTWNLKGYANIGSYGGYMYGNADVTLKNGSSMTASNLGIEVSGEKVVKLTLEDNSSFNATNLTNQGSIVLASVTASLNSNECANVTTNVADYNVAYVDGAYKLVAKVYVAKVGDAKFETLNEAVAAVEDGGTITLIANETFTKTNRTHNSGTWYDGLYYVGDKSFTIDLGGFTISHDGAVNDYLLNFKNSGSKANTITLKNGTIDAGTAAFCAICTSSSQANELTINTEDINIINNISNGSTIKLRGGAVLNVKGGTKITGKNSYLGIECVASTVNIYDGAEIYMNGTTSYNGCLVGACGGGTVNVYGGYGKGAKGGFIAMTSGGTINVKGGEWIANTDGTVGNNSNVYVLTAQSNKNEQGFVGPAIINVTGGTFRGGMDAWVLNNHKDEKAELNISGGNFNANPTKYVEENFVAVENDGVWTVVEAVAKIDKQGYASLQAAINKVQNGETITLIADVAENVTLTEKTGLYYTIDGNGKTMTGTITVSSLSDTEDNRRITIKNINFVDTESGRDFITSTATNHYPRITVEGCSFTGTGKEAANSVAIRLKSSHSVVIKDCTGTGLHSFLQNTSGWNLTIENVKVTDSKSGLALGTVQGVTVKGCDLAVEGYGVRLDAGYNNNAVIEDNKVEAFIPVVVRKATVDSNITVKGENEFTASNTDGLWCAIGTSEYEANGEKPTAATGNVKVAVSSNLQQSGLYGNHVEGSLTAAYAGADGYWGECGGNANYSFELKFFNGETYMGSTSLNDKDNIIDGDVYVTWNMLLNAQSNTDEYWTMAWTVAPSVKMQPNRVEQWVDGVKVAECAIQLNGPDNLNPIATAVVDDEGNLVKCYPTLEAAVAAGNNVAILKAGTYKVPQGKNLTITGAVEGVKFANIGAHNMGGASMTFNNVTFEYGNENYKGLQHSGNLVYNNCTFNGQVFLYGQSETFNKCTFNQTSADAYNVWTYGAKEVAFNECTFNCAGKSVLIYSDQPSATNNVTVTKSQFIASQAVDGKAAIEMDSSISGAISLTIDGETTATDFAAGNVSGNSLWNNKKGNSTDANNDITVKVGDVTVLAPVYEAQIGEKNYRNLQDAVNAVKDGETVVLVKDFTGNITLTEKVGLHYTLDGAGKTMNGKIVITPLSDENDNRRITIKNIKFVNTADAAVDFISCAVTNHYPRLTVKGCTFTGNGKDVDVALRLKTAYGAVIEDCTGTGLHSFLQNTAGKNLTIKGVTVTDSKSAFALGTVQGVTVQGVKVDVKGYGIRLDANTYNNNAVIEDNAIKAFIPVVVRNVNTTSNVIFAGKNEFAAGNTDGKWCVIGATEYEENGKLPAEVAAGNVVVTLKDEKLTYDGIHGAGLAGKGTAEAPYLINNVAELEIFRNSVNAGSTKYNAPGLWVALNADIDLANAEWTVGIGDGHNYSFDGNFDGKKHTIKNLNIKPYADADGYICAGLFGYTYGAVTIKNLTIENAKVEFTGAEDGKTYHNVGILVGFANNKDGKLNVDNVTVKGDIKVDAPQTYGVGVIVGYSYRDMGAITNTNVLAKEGSYIKGQRFVGGITGYSYNGAVIDNCTVENLAITGEIGVGGIAGLAQNDNKIAGCTVKYVTVNGDKNVAYIVGELPDDGGNVTVADNCNAPQPWVGGSWNSGESFVATIGTQYYTSVAKAIEAAKENDVITLIADIAATDIITINKPVTLDGKGKTLTSTAGRAINVDCAGSVGIKNLTINAKGERAINVIQKPANVTIDNVTATAKNYTVNVAGSAANAVVAINNSTLNGLCTVNVSAEGAKVTVDKSTVNCNDNNTTAGEAYAALSLNKDAVGGSIIATNTTINVTDGSDSMKGRNAAENGTVTINGSTDGVAVMVAIIEYAGSDYYHTFATIDAAIDFAKDGETIGLLRNVNLSEILVINKAITLDGKGKTLTSTAGRAINVDCAGNVGIKNLTINAKGERAINVIQNPANVTIDNVTATAANYAVNIATSAGAAKVAITNSNLTGLNVVNVVAPGAEVTINGGTLTCNDQNTGEGYAVLTLSKEAKNGKITADGVNFVIQGDSKKASNGAVGGVITIDGSTDDVSVVVAYISYGSNSYTFTSIEEAIKFAKAGDVVTIMPGEYNMALNVNKAGITVQGEVDADGKNLVKFNGKLNITANGAAVKNIDVKNSGTAAYIGAADVLVENCNLEGSNGLYQSYTKGTVTFKNSVITGATYGVHFDGSTGGNIVIEGCTITGWTSFAGTIANVAISKTTFADGNYDQLRFYQNATLTECVFNKNMTVDFGKNEVEAEFTDCTVENGGDLTDVIYLGDIADMGVKVTIDDKPVYVQAKVGGNYYQTLLEAVEAAEDGKTVTVLTDIALDTKGAMANCAGYPTFVCVEGKAVTIDLNGKDITANAYAEDLAGKMLLGVFSTDNCGKLTLVDSEGSATVTLNAADDAKVYSLLCNYEDGCQIKVDGGTYVANKVIDSMLYTGADAGENEGITVNGGNFTLGNVGEGANGKPWIFNVYQANAGNVVVNGGTFNADVNHQFWANEVFVPETKALKDNGNGTWTVVDAAAYTMELATSTGATERKVGYATLHDAIAAVKETKTITLVKDITYTKDNASVNGNYVDGFVYTGDKSFTIDFNGKTITENGDINDYLVYLKNAGEKDNEITFVNGTIAINGESSNTAWAAITVGANSATHMTTLNLNGMKVVNGNPNDAANQVIRVRKGSVVNLNEGTVVTSNGTSYGVAAETTATVNINDGAKVVQTNSKTTAGNQVYTAVSGNGTINVYDGAEIVSDNYGIHNMTTGNAVINIYGGTIEAKVAVKASTNGGADESATVTIVGGNFKGALENYTDAATIVVKGGTFDAAVDTKYVATGYICKDNGNGTFGVVVDPKHGKVAQIDRNDYFAENQYFATINEAVQAAVNGETVTLIADVVTSAAGYATVGEENYAVLVAVKEKDITLNLNGNSVTVNPTAEELANAEGKMLMSVFGMDTNGKLTLTGSGSVKVNANGANVYSLVAAYGEGSAVVIENGNYEADAVMASGSLIYSHEMITVMGGTFNLGNLDTGANGSPWIFNTIGQNYTGVKVVGGTYPTDINHQFWANEVQVPEAYALENNGDGTWTVVPAVAYTNEKATSRNASWRHVGYASLEDAIAATGKYNCQDNTVTMIKDITLEPITVANGVKVVIDLNGKTISGTDSGTASFGLINNMGDLTINGTGAIQLTATQDRGWNAYSSVISNQVGGKLTVNGGTIQHLGGTAMAWGIDNLTNGKGTYAETVINGGVVKSEYIAIRQFLNGVEAKNILNVYEGTLEGKYSIFFQDPSKSANTGSLYVHADAVLNASVYLGVTAGSTEWPVEVEVAVAALKGESTVVANNVPATYHVTKYPTAWIVECSELAELTIDEADYAKTGYINLVEKNVAELTYVREFTGAWETIYLPFNVKASDLAEAGLKAAYIYNASNKNNDIVIDYVEIEDEYFELMANYPYLICAAEAGVKEIVVETATLKKTTEQETIDCSTVFEKFTFIGNYAANFAPEASVYKKYYVMEGGEWTSLEVLNPFRFYFQMEKRNGGAFSEAQSIRMRSVNANGEETTGINGVDAEQAGDFIFDLHGRRVLETEKGGIYIKGGKKFIAQ